MIISFLFIHGAGVDTSPLLLQSFIGLLYQPWTTEGDICGEISGMNEWQGTPAPVPLCPPQISHDLARARNRASAVGSRRLTRPYGR
jgi:hypothetical protein